MPSDSTTKAGHGAHLFSFAIITDTHIRPPGGDESSPFAVNDLANGRARYAAAAIALHKPEFTIHLGDMVHPLPHLPTYAAAADEARRILQPLEPNLNFVPGNHDVGDKPMAAMPAGPADEASIAIYGQHFGAGFYSFDHKDLHVVVVNSSIVNSGSTAEDEQKRWLEQDLAENKGKRIFLFSHYPPYINAPDEQPHYDNYSEPGRSWLLDLVQRHDAEAVFSGHVHQFFYNRLGALPLYCLPPTSFTRQDYSELYDIGPADQFGRNDEGKFSTAIIDVYEHGHKLRVYPTEGRGLESDEAISEPPTTSAARHTHPFTVHLRHGWARSKDMPFNGPMEEFCRKQARNDYVLLRLWQMGIAHVRTPLTDLLDTEYGPRVRDFHAAGLRFTFFCGGVPSADQWQACLDNAEMIDAVECVAGRADLSDIADTLGSFKGKGGPSVFVGKSHSSADEPKHGSKFAHSVSFGFKWEERDTVLAALKTHDRNGIIQGIVFQVNLNDNLQERLSEMDQLAQDHDLDVTANIRLADVNPAIPNFDDDAITRRVGEALDLAPGLSRTRLQLDTYADIDRGYHPRHGLLDRRYNFRAAGRLLMERFNRTGA